MSRGDPIAAPTCCALWIGGNLGPIAAACLASFTRRGHRVVLYCYDAPKDVPPGIEVADAATVLPADRLFRHKATGSYAIFADYFRYELLRRGLGVWIDCDVYCVRPIELGNGHVYGWQAMQSINNAVLGLPADSPVLPQLTAIFTTQSPVMPWFPVQAQQSLTAAKLSGAVFGAADLPWGATGPLALTYVLLQAGLARHARPRAVFYPIGSENVAPFIQRGVDFASHIAPETLTVHLWNEILRKRLGDVERGSAIDRLMSDGTLFDERLLAEAPA